VRFVAALLLAVALGHVAATPLASALEVCAAACTDDDPEGRCAPTCADCTCCTHAPAAFVACAEAGAARPAPGRCVAFDAAARAPASDPVDVFHVPKPSFA
jgi:hypothetical protein